MCANIKGANIKKRKVAQKVCSDTKGVKNLLISLHLGMWHSFHTIIAKAHFSKRFGFRF